MRQFCIRQSYKEIPHSHGSHNFYLSQVFRNNCPHQFTAALFTLHMPHTVPSTIPTFSTTLTLFPTIFIVDPTESRQRSRDYVRNLGRGMVFFFFRKGFCFKILIFRNCFCFKIFLILHHSVLTKKRSFKSGKYRLDLYKIITLYDV